MTKKIENNLHHLIGGNNRNIPDDIKLSLFKGFPKNSIAKLLLEIAIQSSFDGLQDLKKWKTIGLINAETWTLIEDKLKLAKTNFYYNVIFSDIPTKGCNRIPKFILCKLHQIIPKKI